MKDTAKRSATRGAKRGAKRGTKSVARSSATMSAGRRTQRLHQLHAVNGRVQATLVFTPLVSLGVVHAALDRVLRRAGVVIADGAELDEDGNGAHRIRSRVDLNDYADSVTALVPGDVYFDFEERTDCAPPANTVVSAVATNAQSFEQVARLLIEELAAIGCERVPK